MSAIPKAKTTTKKRRSYRSFPAKVKVEAVLAVWTEKRSPSEICRELDVPWQQLQQWQTQSLEAMMERLEPKAGPSPESPLLNKRLQKLMDQAENKGQKKLSKRLESVQQDAEEASSAS